MITARVLLFASGAVATAVALASCSTFGASDGPPSADATFELAAPAPDGAGADEAGLPDAGRDAEATWCSLHGGATVAFCADFDRAPAPDAFDAIDTGASAAGAVEYTSTTPESSPNALRTTVPAASASVARRALLQKAIHLSTLPGVLSLEVSVRLQGCSWGIGADALATIGFNDNRTLSLFVGQSNGVFFVSEKLTSGSSIRAQDFASAPTDLHTGWSRFVVKVDYSAAPATVQVVLSSATPPVSLLSGWQVQEPLSTQDITLEIGQAPVDPWGACQVEFDDVRVTAQ